MYIKISIKFSLKMFSILITLFFSDIMYKKISMIIIDKHLTIIT